MNRFERRTPRRPEPFGPCDMLARRRSVNYVLCPRNFKFAPSLDRLWRWILGMGYCRRRLTNADNIPSPLSGGSPCSRGSIKPPKLKLYRQRVSIRATRNIQPVRGRRRRSRALIALQGGPPHGRADHRDRPVQMTTDPHFNRRWLDVFIPAEHWHFHRQLLNRCNIVLAPGDFSAIVMAIQNGRARLIERQDKDRAVYSVRIPSSGDRVYVLVADSRRVITVLPPTKRLNGKRRALVLGEASE